MVVVAPIINSNGTNGTELLQQWVDANASLNNALTKLAEAMPHGRDFQTCPDPETYWTARRAHEHRCAVLRDLIAETEAIALKIMEQGRS